MIKRLWVLCLLSLSSSGFADLNIYLVSEMDAPAQPTTFAGVVVEPQRDYSRAIELALSESQIKFDHLGIEDRFSEIRLDPALPIEQQLTDMSAGAMYVLDLPREPMIAVAQWIDTGDAVSVNASSKDVRLRNEFCIPSLYHTLPSERMYADALAQYLLHSGWRKVLLVHGTSEQDLARKEIVAQSVKRFGATIEEERAFTLSHHPDDRDENNPAFLTGGASYDVVVVIDSNRDYGRRIDYNTRRPRPVVGDVGLIPRAWHFALERYGAPQLNERYRALTPSIEYPKVAMTDGEFAAWAAVKLISNSLSKTQVADDGEVDLRALFDDPSARVDLYKGTRGSFRAWNNQLRHPMLLTTGDYVAGIAPLPKFLHPRHYVDTLGADQPESGCQIRTE